MTLSEFKAWLEGYSESFFDGRPNADQWKKIQMKLNSLREANNPIYDYDRYRKIDGQPKWNLKGQVYSEPEEPNSVYGSHGKI